MDEPVETRVGRGQRLIEAVREDLELYGVAELEERVEILQSEIARVNAQIDRKRSGRAAADALFSPPPREGDPWHRLCSDGGFAPSIQCAATLNV